MLLTTLCYLEQNDCWLMLHRTKKQNDINKDKWLGVGGKFLPGESPEDCLLREVREETGLTLTDYRFRGVVTFVALGGETEYMHLFTATGWQGQLTDGDACAEGVLEWVPIDRAQALPVWAGDRLFFGLLRQNAPFFSLKLVYDGEALVQAALNGQPLAR